MRTPTTIGAIISIMTDRPTKIKFAEMRDMGVRGILIYCADYRCTVFELMQQCGWRILPPKDEQTACCGG